MADVNVLFPVKLLAAVVYTPLVTVPAFPVAEPADPVTLPAIGLVTSRSVNHPFNSLDPVTPNDPVIVILLAPISNAPPIVNPVSVPTEVIAVCAALVTVAADVAVAALPVTSLGCPHWATPDAFTPNATLGSAQSVGSAARAVAVPAFPVTEPAVPDTFPVTFPVNGPLKFAAVIVPAEKLPEASRFTMALAVFALTGVAQLGAKPALLWRTSPAVPAASIAVVLRADCQGMYPAAPPAKLVAVPALPALPNPLSPDPSP